MITKSQDGMQSTKVYLVDTSSLSVTYKTRCMIHWTKFKSDSLRVNAGFKPPSTEVDG